MRAAPLALALLLLPAVARAEEPAPTPPTSGTSWLVAGSLLTAAGVANLATAPICVVTHVRESAQPACLATSIGFGAGFLAVGIPLLVVGAGKRATWLDWQRTTVSPVRSGAVVSLGGAW